MPHNAKSAVQCLQGSPSDLGSKMTPCPEVWNTFVLPNIFFQVFIPSSCLQQVVKEFSPKILNLKSKEVIFSTASTFIKLLCSHHWNKTEKS